MKIEFWYTLPVLLRIAIALPAYRDRQAPPPPH